MKASVSRDFLLCLFVCRQTVLYSSLFIVNHNAYRSEFPSVCDLIYESDLFPYSVPSTVSGFNEPSTFSVVSKILIYKIKPFRKVITWLNKLCMCDHVENAY